MSKDTEEWRVYKKNDPQFYEHLIDMSEASVSMIEIDGRTCNIAKDKDENWFAYFVLVPHVDAPLEQHFLYIAVREQKTVIEVDGIRDDSLGEKVAFGALS